MTRSIRLLPAIAGIFLGALGLAALSCGDGGKKEMHPTPTTSAASPYCARPGMAVTVFVEYDDANKKGVTRNQVAYLCLNKDWVEWVSCDGEVLPPTFTATSPFDETHRKIKRGLKLEHPKRKGIFPYTIKLKLPDGTEVNVDPRIEVMD